jgi:FkbM family methyltransferase
LAPNRADSRADKRALYAPVQVDARVIEFAVDPSSGDPIAQELAARRFPGDATNDLWRHLVQPRHTAIDVGAHLGTYALPAAATGAHVLAVEASPANAGLLELAAVRNGFATLQVLRAAADARPGTVGFTALGPWGHLTLAGELESDVGGRSHVKVAAVALDDVIQTRGWEQVDLIKIDVEGSELKALEGLAQVLDRGDAPPLLIEANGHMLHQYGHLPAELLEALEGHGYRCFQIDPHSKGRLVPVRSTDLQAECVADYFACKTLPEQLRPWWVDRPFRHAEVIQRVLATCRDAQLQHREYGARLLATAPAWLLEDESIRQAQRAM